LKIDIFTKIVLTGILACLLILSIKAIQPVPAMARNDEVIKVNLVQIGSHYVWKDELVKKGGK